MYITCGENATRGNRMQDMFIHVRQLSIVPRHNFTGLSVSFLFISMTSEAEISLYPNGLVCGNGPNAQADMHARSN